MSCFKSMSIVVTRKRETLLHHADYVIADVEKFWKAMVTALRRGSRFYSSELAKSVSSRVVIR